MTEINNLQDQGTWNRVHEEEEEVIILMELLSSNFRYLIYNNYVE